jgi:hypothetical protein
MSNFDESIPEKIAILEKSISELYTKKSNLDWGHECDCEFCDNQSDIPEETIAEEEQLNKEINDYKTTISSLKGFAKLKGLDMTSLTTGDKKV